MRHGSQIGVDSGRDPVSGRGVKRAIMLAVCGCLTAQAAGGGDDRRRDAEPAIRIGLGAGGAELKLEFLGAAKPPDGLEWKEGEKGKAAAWRVERTGFKAEVFEVAKLGVWVVHLKCDQPGVLGFSVSFGGEGWNPAVRERRMLVAKGKDGEARAWVFPMESDVETAGRSIVVRGEGEALIVAGAGGEDLQGKLRDVGIEGDRVADVAELHGKLRRLR